MKPALHLHAGQHMSMTPQLLQSIRLLQLSSLELEQELRQSLEQNVMLEADDGTDEDEQVDAQELAERAQAESTEAEVTGSDIAASQKVEADYDSLNAEPGSRSESWEEDEPIESRTAAAESDDARVQALQQLQLVIKTPREAKIVGAILEAIDGNGYLERSLEEIREVLSEQIEVSADEMATALDMVQGVEPTGFGARDLRECLLLQLRALPKNTAQRELAEFVVINHLERLAGGDLAQVAAARGATSAEMSTAVALILSLNPKPGAAGTNAAQPIEPDVIVSDLRGGWKVELNAAVLPRVRVNAAYERMLGSHGHRALREQLQEARWLVRGVEMRHDTLLRTARAIFERQCEFLRRGEEGMAPLTLREIAEVIGMHESTVCRVTSNKYVQTPWGVYELKAFFPSQIGSAEGETSGTAVRAMIRRIIDTESRKSPLCDGAIAAILHRGGVSVARRTVAKYREAMKIAPAKERRAAPPRTGRAQQVAMAG